MTVKAKYSTELGMFEAPLTAPKRHQELETPPNPPEKGPPLPHCHKTIIENIERNGILPHTHATHSVSQKEPGGTDVRTTQPGRRTDLFTSSGGLFDSSPLALQSAVPGTTHTL